ncbi:MAG: hypothetical protein WKG07_14340 [Hymenobacter sp.]
MRKGIEDGGNKSGVPTVNGAIVFDDRYAGKPLVYCGTGAVMPMQLAGQDSWEKVILPGDRIIMAGGRVGKDGIHGATFSSIELDEAAPATAVQIGSPITQKLAMDFLTARRPARPHAVQHRQRRGRPLVERRRAGAHPAAARWWSWKKCP